MTRWSVQIEARFASVWPLAVEEAVAERLDQAGLLSDPDNGIQGDPGPTLCAYLVVEAIDAAEAAASGWSAHREALDAAGAEGYAHQRTIALPAAQFERPDDAWSTGWQLVDELVLRDDLRRTERP